MLTKRTVDLSLFILFIVFSIWLFGKSFGYENGEFRIARHQVGDFGLHIGLIRSISRGSNIPVQSPFYPGPPMPYHYATDFATGQFEKMGIRIDVAYNGISIIFFTLLLFVIYSLSNVIFGYNPLRSLIAVMLFILSSNLTFVTFLKEHTLGEIWRLPDYIFKGPYDGSIISIFSTLNPLLNQRHLIVGLALGMLVIYNLVNRLLKNTPISEASIVTSGILIGLGTRIHSLIALGTVIVIVSILFLFNRIKLIVWIVAFTSLFALPHIHEVLSVGQNHPSLLHLGYIAPAPLTLASWFSFWWQNLGLSLVFLPIGILFSTRNQKRIFFAFFTLFILANIFQLGYRIEHNHSLITMFIIIANIYIAHALVKLQKIGILVCLFFLTASGILNLMVVKNDFQYRVPDAPKDSLITWIIENTPKSTVFLAPQNLYDPVVIAGRKNYFGATYYTEVMGFDLESRRKTVNHFFTSGDIVDVDYFVSETSVSGRNPVFTNEKYWVYKL